MATKIGTMAIGISLSGSAAAQRAIAEHRWRDNLRFMFGDDAARVIARADELSLTTPMTRADAREQAEDEMRTEYAKRIRSFAESVSYE